MCLGQQQLWPLAVVHIIEQMSNTQFDVNTVRNELAADQFSAGTAHYALLCKKQDRVGGGQQKKVVPAGTDSGAGEKAAAKFRIGDDGQIGERSRFRILGHI